jgi:hypothetical protein
MRYLPSFLLTLSLLAHGSWVFGDEPLDKEDLYPQTSDRDISNVTDESIPDLEEVLNEVQTLIGELDKILDHFFKNPDDKEKKEIPFSPEDSIQKAIGMDVVLRDIDRVADIDDIY